MFNKKLIFALIIFIIAISSVSASDSNSTDDAYSYDGNNLEVEVQNTSDVSLSESSEGRFILMHLQEVMVTVHKQVHIRS